MKPSEIPQQVRDLAKRCEARLSERFAEEHPECFRQVAGPLPPSQQQEQDAERLMESAAGRATLSA